MFSPSLLVNATVCMYTHVTAICHLHLATSTGIGFAAIEEMVRYFYRIVKLNSA